LAKAIDAAKAGFDSVVFDLSVLPFEQNVRQSGEAVEALKAINPEILVEGEIGDIGTVTVRDSNHRRGSVLTD
jgi:fructose-bisphosphate aldolase class II